MDTNKIVSLLITLLILGVFLPLGLSGLTEFGNESKGSTQYLTNIPTQIFFTETIESEVSENVSFPAFESDSVLIRIYVSDLNVSDTIISLQYNHIVHVLSEVQSDFYFTSPFFSCSLNQSKNCNYTINLIIDHIYFNSSVNAVGNWLKTSSKIYWTFNFTLEKEIEGSYVKIAFLLPDGMNFDNGTVSSGTGFYSFYAPTNILYILNAEKALYIVHTNSDTTAMVSNDSVNSLVNLLAIGIVVVIIITFIEVRKKHNQDV